MTGAWLLTLAAEQEPCGDLREQWQDAGHEVIQKTECYDNYGCPSYINNIVTYEQRRFIHGYSRRHRKPVS